MWVRIFFSSITNLRTRTDSPTLSYLSRVENKPTRVNEREATKWRRRFSLSTISWGCKTQPPPVVPLPMSESAMRGVASILSLRSHATSRYLSRPFSSTASSTASSLPDSSLRDVPFSRGWARTTLFSASLGSRPLPPPARPPGLRFIRCVPRCA